MTQGLQARQPLLPAGRTGGSLAGREAARFGRRDVGRLCITHGSVSGVEDEAVQREAGTQRRRRLLSGAAPCAQRGDQGRRLACLDPRQWKGCCAAVVQRSATLPVMRPWSVGRALTLCGL